ncbi:uncharacterized protein N7515_005669 [Penicillium bovifimosum]|uniref:Uncharacterized protein n=1 Tax=Penicillium bovifimosum TaxID=126998 RepID=A0A9W9GT60_9EURO|nr:uncharacterized protein N7515_005669 [Penicillium bovifimosum]KAJ5129630.1 hypothetical protein N7515_005669 [Penicillium bovifimosum]
MKEPQRSRDPPETSRKQFRTPRRPSPRGPTTALKNTTAARNRSPESSSTSASTRKRISLPPVQSTLTQIDFVTQPSPLDDDELSYIGYHDTRNNTEGAGKRSRRDDDQDRDLDYRPVPPARSARISMFGANERARDTSERQQKRRSLGIASRDAARTPGPRRNETPRPSARAKGGRKALEKSTGKRDKTLTQMDFVRRYIPLDDDDDDVNMGYIQPTPQNNDRNKKTEQEDTPKPKASQTAKRTTPAKRKRRAWEEELDLSTGEPISQPAEAQDSNAGSPNRGAGTSTAPVTPQKSRMREIPSSQTPESPGLAVITSSQFRSATRSPSKQRPRNPTNNPTQPIKEEPSDARQVAEESQDPGGEYLPPTTKFGSRSIHNRSSPPVPTTIDEQFPSSAPPTQSSSQGIPSEGDTTARNGLTKRNRTVVYETDAESDYGDFDDSLSTLSLTPSQTRTPRPSGPQASAQVTQNIPDSPKDGSQELPRANVRSSPDLDDVPTSEGPMSDASICYRRMHAATQFPHEPIPVLNTQKMSELFPQEGSIQYSKPEPSGPVQKQVPGPFLQTQTQSQTQSQTQMQSQEGDKESTDMVPESSPIRGRESTQGESSFQRPPVPGSEVQVESSQAVDRDPSWQGLILSRSQLLTSSVMESIPLPNFLMGSQESVGSPYSLPEG